MQEYLFILLNTGKSNRRKMAEYMINIATLILVKNWTKYSKGTFRRQKIKISKCK